MINKIDEKIEEKNFEIIKIEEKINNLQKKKAKLEQQVKSLENDKKIIQMDNIEETLNTKGLKIDEFLKAIQTGDFSKLQNNINRN